MLLKYFLKDFEMVTVAPVITGVTFVFECLKHFTDSCDPAFTIHNNGKAH
jgi:hypothetical protein